MKLRNLRKNRNTGSAPKNRGGHGKCAVCQHADRGQIDLELRAGVPLEELSRRWGMSPASLSRHNAKHVSAALVAVHPVRLKGASPSFIERLEGLAERVERFIDAAERGRRPAQFVVGIRELRGLLESIGRAKGELTAMPEVGAIDIQ